MDYHELQKTKVTDLRELMKEKMPDQKGVVGFKKDELIAMLAENMGIDVPHKHVEAGLGKRKIKAGIREMKIKRQTALAAGDAAELKKYRRLIHREKRKLRRMMQLS
ncbi:hypothetical protein DRQ50_10800 [bacterium]|nr:MAG: hypothetical protein DRQ50_10800 [bacterium]